MYKALSLVPSTANQDGQVKGQAFEMISVERCMASFKYRGILSNKVIRDKFRQKQNQVPEA